MKKFLDTLLFSHIFLAFGTVALLYQTGILLQLDISLAMAFLVFFSTALVYNMHQIPLLIQNRPSGVYRERYIWLLRNRGKLHWQIVLPLAGIIISLFFLPFRVFVWIWPAAIASAFYILPLFPAGKKMRRLRDIPGLKILLITFVFAYVTVVLPVIHNNYHDLENTMMLFIMRLLWIFAVAVPFDIRDINSDNTVKLKTLPLLLGVSASKAIAVSSLIMYATLVLILTWLKASVLICFTAGLILAVIIAAFVIIRSAPRRNEYYYSLFADGLLILPFILLLISKHLFC